VGESQRHFPAAFCPSPAETGPTAFRPVRPVTHNTQMTGTGLYLYCGGLATTKAGGVLA
jgi:hypothetical protein